MVSFLILIVGKKQAEENVVQEKDKEEKTNAEETRGWARFHISKEGQREDWRKLVNEYKKEKGKPWIRSAKSMPFPAPALQKNSSFRENNFMTS